VGPADQNQVLALGELRGMLAALAWANTAADHGCTFTVEDLPATADLLSALRQHFGEWAGGVSVNPIGDWHEAVSAALHRWLFQFPDLIRPQKWCALADREFQRKVVEAVLAAFTAGLQPRGVWRVEVEPRAHYACAWDDFAVEGETGRFLVHLGVSD
jgi:hypothetical protein